LNETGLHSMLNMRHDLSNEWQLLKKNGSVKLTIGKSRLPYLTQVFTNTAIEEVMFIAQVKNNPNSYSINIDEDAVSLSKISSELKLCRGNNSDIKLDTEFKLSIDPGSLANLEELIFIIKYKL